MSTICIDNASCPQCGKDAGYSEERFNSHQFFICGACGWRRETIYLSDDAEKIERYRQDGWTILSSVGGTTYWAERVTPSEIAPAT